MEKIKVYLVESKWQDERLLGRKVKDFVLANMQGFDKKIVPGSQDAEDLFEDGALNVVLPLSCPLVTKDDVLRLAKSIRLRGAKRVEFYGSSAVFCLGKGERKSIFVNNSSFFEISDANSFCLVYNILKDRIADRNMAHGVMIFDKASTFIDDTVEIAEGAKILPFCRIEGCTKIECGATVSSSFLQDATVREGANVEYSHVTNSVIGKNATIGPYARLRSAVIGDGCRIGDFVEVKQSVIGNGAKSAHLTYIGDANVGERTNVGCGTVFCNYDGNKKHKTNVGNDCFLGANTNLVAPLNIGDRAFVAAGTTVTTDVDDDMFVIGRTQQKTRIKHTKQQD